MSEPSHEAIEAMAAAALTADPCFEIDSEGMLDVDGLREELDILQEATVEQHAAGEITGEMRAGILTAVAGIRHMIRQAEEGDRDE